MVFYFCVFLEADTQLEKLIFLIICPETKNEPDI